MAWIGVCCLSKGATTRPARAQSTWILVRALMVRRSERCEHQSDLIQSAGRFCVQEMPDRVPNEIDQAGQHVSFLAPNGSERSETPRRDWDADSLCSQQHMAWSMGVM